MILRLNIRKLLAGIIAFVIVFAMPSYVILIPLVVFFTVYFYANRSHVMVLTLGAFTLCCKSEFVYFIFISVLFVMMTLDKKKTDMTLEARVLKKRMKLIMFYLVFVYIIQLFLDTSILSLPFFSLTFMSYLLVAIYVWNSNISQNNIESLMDNLLVIGVSQIIIAFLLQAIPEGIGTILSRPTYGDKIFGTTSNALNFAVVILITTLPPILYNFITKRFKYDKQSLPILLLFASVVFMLLLSDSKTILYALILSCLILLGIKGLVVYKGIALKIISVISLLLILIFSFQNIIRYFEKNQDSYILYVNSLENKMLYYEYTFDANTRSFLQFIIGTGGGTNGSRASNALAYDYLSKTENTSVKLPQFIPPKTNEFTREYIVPLYDTDYRDNIGNMSAILGAPFNSISSLFIELGVLGFFLYLSLYFKTWKLLYKKKNIISLLYLILMFMVGIISFVFPAFESPVLMYFLYLYMGLSFSKQVQTSIR